MVNLAPWLLHQKLCLLRINREVKLTELANLLEVSNMSPSFYKLINKLIDHHALIFTREDGPSKYYKVDNNKLNDLFRKSLIFKKCGEYIEQNVSMYRY